MSLPTRVPFAQAAAQLAELIEIIEDDDNIDGVIASVFEDAVTDVVNSIDRRKAFYREIESKIEMIKQYREEVTKHLKKYEKVRDRLVEITKNVILQHPEITFKDSLGKELKVFNNPAPKLVIDTNFFELESSQPYIFATIAPAIDKDLLKEALLSGARIEGAHLEYGKQLRGMK